MGLQGDPPRNLRQVRGWDAPSASEASADASLRVDRPVVRIDTVPGRVRYGLLDWHPDRPTPTETNPPSCASCRHLLSMIGVGQGLRCSHPAQNPDPEARFWMIPGRWYSCPAYQSESPDA